MVSYLASRPFLGVGVIRDDNQNIRKLLAILIVICIFVYDHRYTFLTLADNINQAFNLFKAIRQTWFYWQYQIKCLVNPFQYGPG